MTHFTLILWKIRANIVSARFTDIINTWNGFFDSYKYVNAAKDHIEYKQIFIMEWKRYEISCHCGLIFKKLK